MMSDLFSSLDCMQSGKLSTFLWAVPIIFSILFFMTNPWPQTFKKTALEIISVNTQNRQLNMSGFSLLLFSLMTLLLIMNFLGLIPFVYGPTSNIWISASIALVLWASLIISGWMKFPMQSIAHFTPSGAPSNLTPLLVIIETASMLIRPITLSVRIIANISAGHIIMGLIASTMTSVTFLTIFTILMAHVAYNMFEIFVCSIQAYVFSLLVKLYGEEHPS